MLTQEHFGNQMNRLASQFGKTAYGTERAKLIWQAVRHEEPFDFEIVVNDFIASNRQAPLLQDFVEALSARRNLRWEKQRTQSLAYIVPIRPSCSYCKDCGDILARLKSDLSPWAFKCSCPAGRTNGRRFPLWENARQEFFEVIR